MSTVPYAYTGSTKNPKRSLWERSSSAEVTGDRGDFSEWSEKEVTNIKGKQAAGLLGPRIVIIGAGMSGLLMAIKLKEAGLDNFILCEKGTDVGGVWRDNTYPGLKCDIPAHMYTYSFESNPSYKQRFAAGSEIRSYLERVAVKFDLRSKIRFGKSIESAVFDEPNGRWLLSSQDGETLVADIVVWAGGILHQPKLPDITGREGFAGHSFHTARWEHRINLRDQRVGIIGTGSTGVQVVAAIASDTKHLTVFQRTPHWIFPLPNRNYNLASQEHVRHWPGYAKFLRWSYTMLFQWTFARAVTGNAMLQKLMQWQSQYFLNRKVKDRVLLKRLTPDYKAGCKRMILARGYYEALQRSNVTLVDSSIQRIVPNGVVTCDGTHHELDVLIYATGFHAHQYMRPMKVIGVEGKSLDDTWSESVFAHRSVALPGFPNFFMLLGPQSPIGNFSAISVAETQVKYLMHLIEEIRSGRCDLINPKQEITEVLDRKITEGMSKTVWVSGCNSWYLDDKGKTTMWPWTFERFRAELKRPQLDEFRMTQKSSKADSNSLLNDPHIQTMLTRWRANMDARHEVDHTTRPK